MTIDHQQGRNNISTVAFQFLYHASVKLINSSYLSMRNTERVQQRTAYVLMFTLSYKRGSLVTDVLLCVIYTVEFNIRYSR